MGDKNGMIKTMGEEQQIPHLILGGLRNIKFSKVSSKIGEKKDVFFPPFLARKKIFENGKNGDWGIGSINRPMSITIPNPHSINPVTFFYFHI